MRGECVCWWLLLCLLLKAGACVAGLRLAWRVHVLAAFALPSSKGWGLRGVAGTCLACAGGFAGGFCFAFFGSSRIAGRVLMLALSLGWLGLSWLAALRRPALLLWARGLWRSLALTLGRVLATFALGSDSVAGRPILRGAATLNGSSVPHGHENVSTFALGT